MAIYDFLKTSPAAAELQFTVDTSVPEVSVGGFPGGVDFFAAGGVAQWFEPGDNIVIQGVWIETPHGFRQATGLGLSVVAPTWEDQFGVQTSMRELADGVGIMMPSFCGIIFPDKNQIFVANPNNGNRLKIVLQNNVFRVSMANVPAILNGLTFTMAVFLLVKHTLPLANVP